MNKYKFPLQKETNAVQLETAQTADVLVNHTAAQGTPGATQANPNNTPLENLEKPAPVSSNVRYLLGSYYDTVLGEWLIARASFDPSTLTVLEIKTERVAGDQEVMRERFEIAVIKAGVYEKETPSNEEAFNLY